MSCASMPDHPLDALIVKFEEACPCLDGPLDYAKVVTTQVCVCVRAHVRACVCMRACSNASWESFWEGVCQCPAWIFPVLPQVSHLTSMGCTSCVLSILEYEQGQSAFKRALQLSNKQILHERFYVRYHVPDLYACPPPGAHLHDLH
eukprot:scaffold30057_cov20-Tisochrysis_lutea.AAC.1